MWEFVGGNTFGSLAFTSYGAFCVTFAVIFIPFFNVRAAYGDNETEFFSALRHSLICIGPLSHSLRLQGWFIFSRILTIGTLRTSVTFLGLFFTVTMAFSMLAIGYYNNANENFIKCGGCFGLLTSLLALYNEFADVWNVGNSYISLPIGRFPPAAKR